MKPRGHLFLLASSILLGCLATTNPTQAQIASDETTPSTVNQSGNVFEITGGTEAGNNLFHSFTEFSVPDGDLARFVNNNAAIQNVISRVTGSSASEIFGKIEAGGSAPNFNLFLLNPKGIIFGPNASLNINGSFVATTANAIQFGEQGFFSASTSSDSSVLTVNPSAFLFNQIAAEPITNQSRTGLRVPHDQSLVLLGGEVMLDRGILTAPNGRVELGGLAGAGIVGLNIDGSKLSLSFPDNRVLADIRLTNSASVDVTNRGSGSIAINAQNLDILGGSSLRSGIGQNLVASDNEPGDITINATEAVTIRDRSFILSAVNSGAIGNAGNILVKAGSLSLVNGGGVSSISNAQGNSGNVSVDIRDSVSLVGNNSSINSILLPEGRGKGGDITIEAMSLSLADGAFVQATTFGKGDAGNVYVRADEFVSLANDTSLRSTQIRAVVEAGAVGDGGIIDIQTRSLSLTGGAQLFAGVFRGSPGGQGKGGNIMINASDSVTLSGTGNNRGFSSGLVTATEEGAIGSAGNITVNTGGFRIADGAIVSAQTLNQSSGGNITINATTFDAVNGGQIITTASSSGNAGNVTLKVTDRTTLSGSDPTFASRREQFKEIVQNEEPGSSGLFASTRPNSSGQGGDINISTGQLLIQDGAEVNVSSAGTGNAGDIEVTADSIELDDRGKFIATSESGEGGDIRLQDLDLLLLRNNSEISTTAGSATSGTGNGGNITIDTGVLVGLENSDITANAFEGEGGFIQITAQGIFGLEVNETDNMNELRRNNTSDISAASQKDPSLNGRVEINRPEAELSSGLVTLPAELVDVSRLIAQGCAAGGGNVARAGKFVATGRGGLPPTPTEALRSDAVLADLGTPVQGEDRASAASPNLTNSQPTPIVEAQGWVIGSKGEVVLTAQAPTVTRIPWLTPTNCNAS